jgi:sn-glycerol 3-phosphate transport system ATP-binding protein/multiple sugar transport system ATP-binding protein
MAEVRIENLEKKFGDVTAVQDLSLAIADGEFLTLLGPSGCGKTTTLRCIAGLERQSAGDIRIGQRVVNDLPPGERDVAMVFQFYALYPHLNAYENIAFPLRTQKLPRAEVESRVREAANLLNIAHLLDRRPKKLSGGEQQRVALGRAIVRRPQVFLMDEPLASLDPRLRGGMRVEIKRLQRALRTTMVYVTHDQTEALSMPQRIAIMNQGVLQQVGSPLDIYNRPATLFVASFIGRPPMNLVDCSLDDEDEEEPVLRDRSGSFVYHLSPPQYHRIAAHPGRAGLVYGIRPEDIDIHPGGEGDGLPSAVRVREMLGDETLYDLEVGGQVLRVKAPPALRLQVGERVRLALNPDRSHVFAKATGNAIF